MFGRVEINFAGNPLASASKKTSTNAELQQQLIVLKRQLAQSETWLRSFLSLTHQIFCCLKFDPPVPTQLPAKDQAAMMLGARVVDCNLAFVHLCGADEPADLIGSRFVSLVSTTNETLVERALRFIHAGYHVDGVHNTETLHDGAVRHFINSSRGEIENGHLVRVWITGRDVTCQTLIEAASKQGVAALCRTAEKLDSAFWVMDWNRFEALYSGPAIEQRWGISPEHLLEDPLCWLEKVHEHDRQRVRDAFLTHAATGGFDETFRVYLPDGSVGWMRNHCFALPDATGDELRVVGIVQDVSDYRRAQTGLSNLFQVTTEMLFVMDALGYLQEFNENMAQTLGYESDQLRGISLFDLLHSEEHSAGRQALSKLASGKPLVEAGSRFLRKDGTVCPVEWNAAPAGDDRLIYAAARDVSNQLTEQSRKTRQDKAAAQMQRLSPRERQIVEMVVAGKANKVIATELHLSKRTVETHRANLMKKLGLRSAAELIRLALQAAG